MDFIAAILMFIGGYNLRTLTGILRSETKR